MLVANDFKRLNGMSGGAGQYPLLGVRCVFVLKGGTTLHRRPVMRSFHAYGYRSEAGAVYRPYWGATLRLDSIDRWVAVPGPAYHNGSLKPLTFKEGK